MQVTKVVTDEYVVIGNELDNGFIYRATITFVDGGFMGCKNSVEGEDMTDNTAEDWAFLGDLAQVIKDLLAKYKIEKRDSPPTEKIYKYPVIGEEE